MGVSTDGILFYGIVYGECLFDHLDEVPQWWDDGYGEWEEYYIERIAGFTRDDCEDYSEYYDRKKPILKEADIMLGYHCSDGCTMYYVALASSNHCASRGDPEEIKSFEIPENADKKIRKFCEIMGFEYEQPKWWLASYWG